MSYQVIQAVLCGKNFKLFENMVSNIIKNSKKKIVINILLKKIEEEVDVFDELLRNYLLTINYTAAIEYIILNFLFENFKIYQIIQIWMIFINKMYSFYSCTIVVKRLFLLNI